MENRNQAEEAMGKEAMQDIDLEQVSGGSSVAYTGEFYLELSEGNKMNNLWDAMYVYGAYGRAVKEVVDDYCLKAGLQKNNGIRWITEEKITVYAKDNTVTVNGVTLSL